MCDAFTLITIIQKAVAACAKAHGAAQLLSALLHSGALADAMQFIFACVK